MPKSRIRRGARRNDPDREPAETVEAGPSGRWVVPTMCALLALGLIWIVLYYVLDPQNVPPFSTLGGWNLIIGMGLITGGFITATQWR